MYKDINHEDMMYVENKLSDLKCQVANVIQNIIETSNNQDEKIVLLRKDLEVLCKFFFIINYRNSNQ